MPAFVNCLTCAMEGRGQSLVQEGGDCTACAAANPVNAQEGAALAKEAATIMRRFEFVQPVLPSLDAMAEARHATEEEIEMMRATALADKVSAAIARKLECEGMHQAASYVRTLEGADLL